MGRNRKINAIAGRRTRKKNETTARRKSARRKSARRKSARRKSARRRRSARRRSARRRSARRRNRSGGNGFPEERNKKNAGRKERSRRILPKRTQTNMGPRTQTRRIE